MNNQFGLMTASGTTLNLSPCYLRLARADAGAKQQGSPTKDCSTVRSAPRTVLFVSHSSGLYGAERSLLALVLGLNAVWDQLRPVVLAPREGPLLAPMRDVGIEVIVQPFYGWLGTHHRLRNGAMGAVLNLAALTSLSPKLRSLDPCLVYSNTLSTPFGAMISWSLGVPHIWHAREFVQEDMNAYYYFGTTLTMAIIRRTSARFICNSYAVKHKLSHSLQDHMLDVIYNGIKFIDVELDDNMENKITYVKQSNKFTLTIIGRIHPRKGQEDAVRALHILVSKELPVQLVIAGSGDNNYVAFLHSLADDLGVGDRIMWPGFVTDTSALLANTTVLLTCSRAEAFGRVAVEALGSGTPVVAARAGGLPEIVTDHVTGLLYPPGDHEALAECINRLLVDQELYDDIVREGRRTAMQRFGVDRYVSEIRDVIERVVEENKS